MTSWIFLFVFDTTRMSLCFCFFFCFVLLSFLRDSQQFLLFIGWRSQSSGCRFKFTNIYYLRMVSRCSSSFSNKINYTEVTVSVLTCFDGNFFFTVVSVRKGRGQSPEDSCFGGPECLFSKRSFQSCWNISLLSNIALKTSNQTDGPPDWHHHP